MNLKKLALAVGALVVSGSAAAELSANIGATSNYVWRGVTQTDDSAAISGGLDYAHDSGFYLGTWVSNVDFADASGGQVEADLYGGYANELANGLGYDVGLIYYAYPQANKPDNELDFTEVYGSLSFGPVSGGIHYTIDTEAGGDDNHIYYYVGAGIEVMPTWSVGGTLGMYDFDDGSDYTHGQLDLTKDAGEFGEFTLSLSNVLDDDDDAYDEDLLVFVSWGKSFD